MSKAWGLFFGAFGNVLGVFNTIMGLIPEPHPEGTRFHIGVALNAGPQQAMDYKGRVDVRAFNIYGELLGPAAIDQFIHAGDSKYELIYVHDDKHHGQQAAYALFTGNDDAICIAWTAVAWPDGTKYMVTGDWGHESMCGGAQWGISNLVAGNSAEGLYRPYCLWIDKNGDVPTTAFQFFYPKFAPNSDKSQPKLEQICDNVTFKTSHKPDENYVFYYVDPWPQIKGYGQSNAAAMTENFSSDQQTHQRKKPRSPKDSRLIVTSRPQHRGSELCNSSNSRGPSVVSQHEGTFCDMTTKTLYQLCGKGFEKDSFCFNETTMSVESADVTGRVVAKRTRQFDFSEVMDWTKDGTVDS